MLGGDDITAATAADDDVDDDDVGGGPGVAVVAVTTAVCGGGAGFSEDGFGFLSTSDLRELLELKFLKYTFLLNTFTQFLTLFLAWFLPFWTC